MIGLAGVPGGTSQLVMAELDRRGLRYRTDGLDGVDILINAGEPSLAAVEAAEQVGAGYLDGSPDPDAAEAIHERFAASPVLVVPGCAPEHVLGDLAAAIAARDAGDTRITELVVGYDFGGGMPPFAKPARWARRRRIRFPGDVRRGVEVQWGERVRLPRWLPGARATTVLAVSEGAGTFLQVAGVLDPVSRYLPSPVPALAAAGGGRAFRILAEARAGRRRTAVLVEASGGSALATRVLVEAALQAGGAGALTPAQALDPEPFLASLCSNDLTWQRVDTRP